MRRLVRRGKEVAPNQEPIRLKLRRLEELARAVLSELEALSYCPEVEFGQGFDLREKVRQYECEVIRQALQRAGGNQTRAAELLGVKLSTLNGKVKRYRLSMRVPSSVLENTATPLSIVGP